MVGSPFKNYCVLVFCENNDNKKGDTLTLGISPFAFIPLRPVVSHRELGGCG